MPKKWIPLESNPEVITEFASRIGLDTKQWAFHDVFGLDEELLAMVPQPVLAVMLLFPITKESEEADKKADAERPADAAVPEQLYYMKQTIGNACGTIAMLHSIGNNRQRLQLEPGSFLTRFFEATQPMGAAERGAYLESPPGDAPDIEEAHQAAGAQGDTAPPPAEQDVDLHFIAFVEHGGQLWELDGRRKGPISHGPSQPDSLLQDVARVAKDFMARTNSLNFNLIALASADA
uniref:Ubiquitin carboxyl-terminal hydrolase n=1 Tax=Tetradesmus obliquus TaxID=3088 RepID=A0A383W0T3_TETOB|eukprot:jgi/Sobl393_1/500/SZX71287.1